MAPRIFFHALSMALYHKWDVKNYFAYVLQFFSLISDGLGSVLQAPTQYFQLEKIVGTYNSYC